MLSKRDLVDISTTVHHVFSSSASQEDKGVTNALKTNGWHSLNNFLLAFYTSNDFHQSTSSKELELYTWPVLELLQKKYTISGWIMGH